MGAVDAFEAEIGYELIPESWDLYDRKLAACRGEQFDSARETGRRLTLAEAVEVAMGSRRT